MTEKIEWYKEVLELEPNSKVFFPLARLLADAGRDDEAIAALEHGLERHSEFLEARLFLIELLYRTGRQDACARQIERLSAMFSAYAGFWQAWAACLSEVDGEADTATVLRFLAAHFVHGPLSLHEVLNRGLDSLEQGGAPRAAAPAREPMKPAAAAPKAPPAPVAAPAEEIVEERMEAAPAASEVSIEEAAAAPLWEGAPAEAASTLSADTAHPEDDSEEHFSLRTRSMAEVLAEQGDIRGALDIYNELAAAATLPEECADLQHRIATLTARLGHQTEAPQPAAPAEEENGRSTDRLISMLEALAERVEARARG
ncbi:MULTISPECIES: tetratricopeptide repeat protein [unclassified Desulfovibrio]|uniref:tetratricopeptide repeat protein n=1 Tax=unclassified Desulfovibrio TaxID=2593640 RepID=UPI0013EB2342|nr:MULTISPECIES: tetratricopeptide repeat protein [unclassified Desulfovibrio]